MGLSPTAVCSALSLVEQRLSGLVPGTKQKSSSVLAGNVRGATVGELCLCQVLGQHPITIPVNPHVYSFLSLPPLTSQLLNFSSVSLLQEKVHAHRHRVLNAGGRRHPGSSDF